jgi:hypothetical protein
MTIAELGSAAGVSSKQTYTVLLRLRNRRLIRVMSKRGYPSRFSMPRVSPAPLLDRAPSAAPAPPRSPRAPEPRMPPAPPAEPAPKMNRGALSPAPNALTSKPHESQTSSLPPRQTDKPPLPAVIPPAPPLTQAEKHREECRHLASALMGGVAVDDQILAGLHAAIQHQSPKPGSLLHRLQEIWSRGARGLSLDKLTTGLQILNRY